MPKINESDFTDEELKFLKYMVNVMKCIVSNVDDTQDVVCERTLRSTFDKLGIDDFIWG